MRAIRISLIVAIILVIGLFMGWSRMPDIIASNLSKKLQVSVEIDDIFVRPGRIEIDKLELGSPAGYKLPRSLSVKQIKVEAPLLHYFDQNIVIDEIVLDTVYIGIEFDAQGSKQGNWTQILQNYKDATGDAGTGKNKGKDDSGKSVLIKRLVIKTISVDLAFKDSGKVKHLDPIDRIEFTNVTSEGGIPTDQITRLVMQQMLNSIFSKENIQTMIEGFMQSPEQGIQNLLQPFKGLMP